jgi:hypothetical protein
MQRKWIPRVLIAVLLLAALVGAAAGMAQRPPVVARATVAGEVVPQHLIQAGQVGQSGRFARVSAIANPQRTGARGRGPSGRPGHARHGASRESSDY